MKKLIVFFMMLIIAISPLFRGLFFDLESSAFLAVLALLSFIYFMIKLANKEDIFFNKWLLIFGTLLIAAYCMAFIKAVNPRDNFTSLIQVTEYLVFAIILYDFYKDKRGKLSIALMAPMVLSTFINAIIGLEAITGAFKFLNDTLNNTRVGGTLQYANTVAIYYIIAIIFSLTLMYLLDKPIYRILLSGVNTIILLAMLLTRSRGGYIVGFLAILFLLIIQVKGYRLKTTFSFFCSAIPAFLIMQEVSAKTASQDAIIITKLLIISFAVTVFLAIVYEGILFFVSRIKKRLNPPKTLSRIVRIWTLILIIITIFLLKDKIISLIPDNIIERFARIGLSDNNIAIRITFDIDALKLISKNWLFGVGGGGWEVLYYGVQDFYYISRAVHNHFLEVFVEAGILGFLSFSTIIFLSLFYMVRGIIKAENTQKKIYLTGLFAGFAALVIHSTFDFDLSYVSIGLMLWAMIVSGTPEMKHIIKLKGSWAAPILLIISTALILINGITAIAAFNAKKGLKLTTKNEYTAARPYYEEALRLDPYNYKYSYELSKLYSYFSYRSNNEYNQNAWNEAALSMAERSTSQNPYLPDNTRMLIRAYYTLNRYFEGIKYAEKLIVGQPYYIVNYDLLAQGYLEAGKYYLKLGNMDTATDFFEKCSKIKTPVNAEGISNLSIYIEEALTLMEKNSM